MLQCESTFHIANIVDNYVDNYVDNLWITFFRLRKYRFLSHFKNEKVQKRGGLGSQWWLSSTGKVIHNLST